MASHPHDWCAKCGQIAKGKSAKINEGRLDIPAWKRKPAKKAPAKKATTRKPKAS